MKINLKVPQADWARKEQALKDAVELLEELEWSNTIRPFCQICLRHKPPSASELLRRKPGYNYGEHLEGHKPDCKLAATIKRLKGE